MRTWRAPNHSTVTIEPVPMMELKPKKKPEARADLSPHCSTCRCALPYLSVDASSFAKERTCTCSKNHQNRIELLSSCRLFVQQKLLSKLKCRSLECSSSI